MQISTDGGNTFVDMDRRADNFPKARGTLESAEITIKVWAGDQSVIATGVSVSDGSFDTGSNFA